MHIYFAIISIVYMYAIQVFMYVLVICKVNSVLPVTARVFSLLKCRSTVQQIFFVALLFSTKQDQQYGVLAEIFFSGNDTNTEKRR
jgi:hypothetical protein